MELEKLSAKQDQEKTIAVYNVKTCLLLEMHKIQTIEICSSELLVCFMLPVENESVTFYQTLERVKLTFNM